MILLPLNTTDPRYEERRSGADRRQTVDRRGAYTVEVDGKVVIRPRSDLTPAKAFDAAPADVSFDDTLSRDGAVSAARI